KAESKKGILSFLHEHELDLDDELVIRREIGTNGKSRGFINDTQVTVAQLSQLSSLMVDLHQQFDTLALTENDFQLQVIDALANEMPAIEKYQKIYHKWQDENRRLAVMKEQ